ncbi:MAG: protein kinase [Planctomycetes bacterium]|nr:protein kinase [Planctomycetota bacterium]
MRDTASQPPANATGPPDRPIAAQAVIGPYRLVRLIGRGGMGVVYEAVHQVTNRAVALKVIDLDDNQLKHHLERVTHEAMAMAALRHPHVITCYSFGEDGRHLYLALELIRGGDTVGLVASSGGQLDETTIRTLARQCAEGLDAINRAGLVHRDIKPANILLDEQGNVKLADFGLACVGQPPAMTGAGAAGIMPEPGTPAYMPPEAITAECTPDIRGDLYSLGVTMYYWAVGRSPFTGSNGFSVMQRVLTGEIPHLATLRSDLSPELVAIITTAMQVRRELRQQNPLAFLRALRGEPATDPAAAPTSSPTRASPSASAQLAHHPTPPARPTGSWVTIMGVGVGAVAALVAVLVAVLVLRPDSTQPVRATLTEQIPTDPTGPAHQALGDGYRLLWLGDPLVRFRENGAVSYARSGQHLHLANDAWLDGTPAPALIRTLAASGEFSVELVMQPANLTQEGPARIFVIGLTQRAANFMIGQSGSRLELRVRTSATNPDGTRPHLVSENGLLTGELQHVVFVRRGTLQVLYVDGKRCCAIDVPGELTWDPDYPLCVGNDHRGGFPWNGSCERLVLAGRAWTDQEAAARYRTWAAEGPIPPAR